MESLRLRTKEHELVVSQRSNFTVVVIQEDSRLNRKDSMTLPADEAESAVALG